MIESPIFKILNNSSEVTSLLKNGTMLRVFKFGNAPQGAKKPYLIYSTVSGSPYNSIGDKPTLEAERVQIDIYARDSRQAREIAQKVELALEEFCYVVSYNGDSYEGDTKLFRVSFDVEFHNRR